MSESGNKNAETQLPVRLVTADQTLASREFCGDATDLAKLATDVIALNRLSSTPPEQAEKTHRTPRVASLSSLRCGLKIRRETAPESSVVRSFVKE